MSCPNLQDVIEHIDGLAPRTGHDGVERHLASGCATCVSVAAWYESVRAAAKADRFPDPPDWVVERTIAAIRDARDAARRRGLRGFVARIGAALVSDNFSPAPAFARGVDEARQLLYTAESYDVDLLVTEAGMTRRLRVAGQVLAADFGETAQLRVELGRDGRVDAVAETSDVGEFEFDDVEPGRYDIHIFGGHREIVVARVPVALE
jgi:hypothetical protein